MSDCNNKKNCNGKRREFLKYGALGMATLAMGGCNGINIEELLQDNFRELSKEELQSIINRLEKKHSKEFGKPVTIDATPAQKGVVFGYGLDISRCVGCRKCVYACVGENNQSRDPEIQWIRVLEMDKDHGVNLHHANPYYNHEEVPKEGHFYFPVQCQQCRHPACVKTCPVGATWQESDGIIVIDYNWCIGCRCCMAACPYGARKFNWAKPKIPKEEMNPKTHYLGNRPRMKGVVEKCTFCIQRTRKGRYPACVEICPVGSRKFGNLLDPNSEIRKVMETKRVFIFKEELATHPKFYYFYG
jgi:molybdopterin-containing oxidoreductase family iron-sulfur binding subunit